MIISTTMLTNELPSDATDTNNVITNAVSMASSFVNTWAKNYDPFDDYQVSPEIALAPDIIVRICIEVAKAYYYMGIGQIYRDGNENTAWNDQISNYREQLLNIIIEPTWETQTISLNTYNTMIIGSRTITGGMWPRVIPHNAQVIGSGSNVWTYPDDWYIRKGGVYDNEYLDAWYLDCTNGSSVEGTLRYMRTYRNDYRDYARYSEIV